MRRRDVDHDALAAGFDDMSRGAPRPAAPLPGTVVDGGALLPPIHGTTLAELTVEPTIEATVVATVMDELVVEQPPVEASPARPQARRSAPLLPVVPPVTAPPPAPSTNADDAAPAEVVDDLDSVRAPVVFRRRRRRARVRRVTRVVRHVDTWSVFKVALVFNLFLYLVCLTAGVLLWEVAYTTGTVSNVERFFEGFGWRTFEFKGGEIYHSAWIAGLFVSAGLTGFTVLLATLFNLITDLVGGVRVTVLEEEVLPREERTPRRVVKAPRAIRSPRPRPKRLGRMAPLPPEGADDLDGDSAMDGAAGDDDQAAGGAAPDTDDVTVRSTV
jgi:hypothetical protein